MSVLRQTKPLPSRAGKRKLVSSVTQSFVA